MKPSLFLTIILVLALLCFCSCNYYSVSGVSRQQPTKLAAQLDSLRSSDRYLILRNGLNDAFHIENITVNTGGQTASFTLGPVNEVHKYYLTAAAGDKRYRRKNALQKPVVNEAHIFIPYDAGVTSGSHTLSLEKIERIETLRHDAKRSTNSHVLSGLGIVAGGLGLALVIVLATIPYD